VLTEINFEVVRDQSEGRLIGVVGSIGSGKTSFLLSILSEIPTSVGKVEVVGSIAYVEQEPYIFPGTV
jgi:ABC-type polysaccharide/polyol phosphate transport system ATPase subunit